MALCFLYLAFLQVLELLRLERRDDGELAIEVVMVRHEVSVLLARSHARRCARLIERCLPD